MNCLLRVKIIAVFLLSSTSACVAQNDAVIELTQNQETTHARYSFVQTGADQTGVYLPLLKDKKIALVANQTSVIQQTHLVDSLLSLGISIQRVFAPEHGFRGDQDAGAHIQHDYDTKTGLQLFSLHGKTKKPTKESLKSIDLVVFDIQDVGVRFYTYISTLHYVMEACAEKKIPLIVLDRPNPNAYYVAGPILQSAFTSFVGKHPVPVVYGMTIGEYALMINGEFWLKDSVQCDLTVIPLKNWQHTTAYSLPISPSPNLPNDLAIQLYPSLCFFEGTVMNEGRGTDYPFQQYGHPNYTDTTYSYTPMAIPGKSVYPKQLNKKCYGKSLVNLTLDSVYQWKQLNLAFLVDAYKNTHVKDFFDRPNFFNLLEGQNELIQAIQHDTLSELQKKWQREIDDFMLIRAKYLRYD